MQWEQPAFLEIRMDAELTYVNDLDGVEAAARPDAPGSEVSSGERPVLLAPLD